MRKLNKFYQFAKDPKKDKAVVKNVQWLSFYKAKITYFPQQGFIVPNITDFVREVTEHGTIGALKNKLLELSIFEILRLLWWNKFNFWQIINKDFATGILLLIQIEILKIKFYRPSLVILSDQVTDISLALDNRKIIRNFISLVKEKLKLKVGIITNNLPLALYKLSECKASFDYIFFPFNSYGYEMNPTKHDVEVSLSLIDIQKAVAIVVDIDKKEVNYLNKFNIKNLLYGWFE